MAVSQWSWPRFILTVCAWLVGFPVLLFAALVLGLGNIGFTMPILAALFVLWFGPAVWLLVKRRRPGSRTAADAA
jgi:hypothetical protein